MFKTCCSSLCCAAFALLPLKVPGGCNLKIVRGKLSPTLKYLLPLFFPIQRVWCVFRHYSRVWRTIRGCRLLMKRFCVLSTAACTVHSSLWCLVSWHFATEHQPGCDCRRVACEALVYFSTLLRRCLTFRAWKMGRHEARSWHTLESEGSCLFVDECISFLSGALSFLHKSTAGILGTVLWWSSLPFVLLFVATDKWAASRHGWCRLSPCPNLCSHPWGSPTQYTGLLGS